MDFPTIDEAHQAIASMAPGFLILFLRSQFISGRLPTFKEGAFYYVVMSAIYYSLAFPIYRYIGIENSLSSIAYYFFGPIIVGIALGIGYQKQIIRSLAQRVGLVTVHSAPSAWDFLFQETLSRPWTWVVITTKDNEKLYGLFGGGSFASSSEENRDIFIEKLADSNFTLLDQDHGLWIKEADIKFLEIIPG